MDKVLLVMLGGGVGAAARYGVGLLSQARLGQSWPGTLAVNVAGGFAMGLLAGWLALRGGAEPWRLLLGTGLLGGFTTFSAFSLETALMLEQGRWAGAAAYATGSAVLSVAALIAGMRLARGVLA